MVATRWDEQQIQDIAREFAPDVVRVRVNYGEDWEGEPLVAFHVILSDNASVREKLRVVAQRVRSRFSDELGLWQSVYTPVFRFRSESEQARMKDPAWA